MELEQYVKITLNVLIFARTKFREFFWKIREIKYCWIMSI